MKVCVYTNGGGEGVLATDALELLGLEVPETPNDLKERLSKILPHFASLHNPIDTTAQADEDTYIKGLMEVVKSKYFDAILAILLPQLPWYTEKFVEKFSSVYNKEIPVVFVIYGGYYAKKIAEKLEKIVPVFESPIQAAKSIYVLSKC